MPPTQAPGGERVQLEPGRVTLHVPSGVLGGHRDGFPGEVGPASRRGSLGRFAAEELRLHNTFRKSRR
jgi:hypothetical protein